jgi:hypothetical protein
MRQTEFSPEDGADGAGADDALLSDFDSEPLPPLDEPVLTDTLSGDEPDESDECDEPGEEP